MNTLKFCISPLTLPLPPIRIHAFIHRPAHLLSLSLSQAGANAIPADPAAVQQLVGMGFSDAAVRRALAMAGGDVDAAANVLLEGR